MSLHKLNGWQRIWLVLAVISTIPFGVFVYEEMPTQAEIDKPFVYETIDTVKKIDPSLKDQFIWGIREAYHDLSDKGLVVRIRENTASPDGWEVAPFTTSDKSHNDESEGLLMNQFETIFVGLMSWAFSGIILYLLGWSVGWVYRGFKKPAGV